MEKDFHYNVIYSIAKLTDFPNADIIAYSSQYVDDNIPKQYFKEGKEAMFPRKIRTNGAHYYPLITQTISTKSLDIMVQKYVYVPFHFLPGDRSVQINGKINPYCTTPNSENAKSMLGNALQRDNPYLLGIALHTFADTWSHQNFTGFQEEWNSVYPQYNIFKRLVPNIGHAEAGHSPDVISETWTDHRFRGKVDNSERALAATGEIYKALRKKMGKGPIWTDIKSSYKQIINASDSTDRVKKISELLNDNSLGEVPDYSERKWIDSAIDINSYDEIEVKPGFNDTQWYHFQQAAKIHFATAMDLIKDL